MKLKDVKIGQSIYIIGIDTIRHFKYINNGKYQEVDAEAYEFESKKHLELEIFESEDEAKIKYYKDKIDICSRHIMEFQKEITKDENKIKKINNEFGYLKDKYPENFI